MGKTKTAFIGESVEEKPKKVEKKPEKVHIAGLKGGQRIKAIEVELPPTEPTSRETPAVKEGKKIKAPKVRGKKYKEAKSKVNPAQNYLLPEAIKLVKETSYSKFDGSVELHLVVKKTGTSANLALPHGAGREKKIEVASDETLKKIQAGKINFDVLLATSDMMPKLVPYARVLGPRGLMPNPKNGTLIKNIKDAGNFSASTLALKTEKEAPLIHTVVGKVSQEGRELKENVEAILAALGGTKQIVRAYIKATMGPSVKIQVGA